MIRVRGQAKTWPAIVLALIGLGCVAAVIGIGILRSDWVRNKVRQKIVAVAEKVTGGRVEIGEFAYDWRDLTASVAPFVLHGTEPASELPLFRADHGMVDKGGAAGPAPHPIRPQQTRGPDRGSR